MLMLILGAILLVALFYHFTAKRYSYWQDKGVQQGKVYWVFGDNYVTLFKKHSITDLVLYVYNKCPGTRYSGMYQFFLPTLVVRDPDLLKQITVKDFDHFSDHRTFIPDDADMLWSRNLFSLTGQKWREMRSILSPSFTTSKIKAMFVLMDDCAKNFVQHFLKKDEDLITVEMRDVFSRFTNDVIATTAFGVKVDSLEHPNNEFYLMGKETTDLTGFRKIMKLVGYFFLPKLLSLLKIQVFNQKERDFFLNLVNDTIKTREEQGIVRPDMINLLMEARKGKQHQEEHGIVDAGFATAQDSDIFRSKSNISGQITNMDIASQAMVFFFAGFDTVAGMLCFAAHEIAIHPDVQERLREEVNTTMEECDGRLTYEGLTKMKYMDMVISEALRMWPNAIVVDRVCTKPYTIEPTMPGEKPVHLEEGTTLWLPTFAIHRDPEHFPDPDRFDPERFSDENKKNIKPYTYFPFGLGPRNCIGSRFALLEMKAVFFHILLNFEIVPVEKTRIPLEISRNSLTLTAEGGFWLGLKRIKN